MVKALDCGVRGHRFRSHQLLPRESFSPRSFLLEFSLPTGEDLNISHLCFLYNPVPRGKMKKNKKIKFFIRPLYMQARNPGLKHLQALARLTLFLIADASPLVSDNTRKKCTGRRSNCTYGSYRVSNRSFIGTTASANS